MRFGNLCVHARTIACIFCYFCCCHEYRNRCRFIVARRRLRRAGFAFALPASGYRPFVGRTGCCGRSSPPGRGVAPGVRREIRCRRNRNPHPGRAEYAGAGPSGAAEQRMAEARAEREKMEETFRTQFKNLANDILGEQSRTFKETNREALDVLLKPFRDNIVEFRELDAKNYSS